MGTRLISKNPCNIVISIIERTLKYVVELANTTCRLLMDSVGLLDTLMFLRFFLLSRHYHLRLPINFGWPEEFY